MAHMLPLEVHVCAHVGHSWLIDFAEEAERPFVAYASDVHTHPRACSGNAPAHATTRVPISGSLEMRRQVASFACEGRPNHAAACGLMAVHRRTQRSAQFVTLLRQGTDNPSAAAIP